MRALVEQFRLALVLSALTTAATAVAAAAAAVRRRRSDAPTLAPVSRILALGSAALIVAATASPYAWPPGGAGVGQLIPALGRGGLAQWRHVADAPESLATVLLVANVVLYVPLGLFVTLGWRPSAARALAACVGLAVAVEAVQFLFLSRVAATDDVLLNGAGALVGIAAARLLAVRARAPATSRVRARPWR